MSDPPAICYRHAELTDELITMRGELVRCRIWLAALTVLVLLTVDPARAWPIRYFLPKIAAAAELVE